MFPNVQRSTRSGRLRPLLAAAVLLAASAACGDAVVSPLAAPAAPLGKRIRAEVPAPTSGSGAALTPNAVKYRDNGAPHATGRSGSATLEGRAVVDARGLTRLTITTGQLDSPTPAPGQIVKAQIKIYSADGSLVSVDNRNQLTGGGVQTFDLGGLPPGATIRVQANVRGIDGNRTDVVTLTMGVAHAARLGVELELPRLVAGGMPVVIDAVVSELGGDVGTRADCVLYVDGQEVDRANDIWVDAGDVVTCAFTHAFTAGSHTVEVRVNGVSGTGSLVATPGMLDVGSGGGPPTYTADVEDRSVTTTSVLQYTWWKPDGSHKEYSDTQVNTVREQTISVQGTLGRTVGFPLAVVDLSVESAGVEWETEHWTGLDAVVDASTGSVCVNRQIPDHGALLFVCNGAGGASFGYSRFAGNVTYHSYGYANTFDGIAGTAENYSWNGDPSTTYGGGGSVRAFGSEVRMRLSIRDAQGTITVSPLVAIAPFSGVLSVAPLTCTLTTPGNLEGGQLNYCTGERRDESGWRGSASG
ncbi:MAG TPA: hypothetical protein VM890_03500 [Longimicrobium sp.]|nr:hypothetical protein [Longimicrobium sp.]